MADAGTDYDEAAITATVDGVVDRLGGARRDLIAHLQALQSTFHYLPAPALARLAARLGVSEADVTGVATFFGQFRLRPAGQHTIRVCIGTACHVKGAEQVYNRLRQELTIADGDDTDAARLFTVEKVACLGCCMLAPAVQIDEAIYGPVEPARVPAMLRDFLADAASSAPTDAAAPVGRSVGEVRLCTCSSCAAAGARAVATALIAAIRSRRLPLRVREVGCLGVSYHAPIVEFALPAGCVRYGRVQPRDVGELLARHGGRLTPLLPRLAGAARQLMDRLMAGDRAAPPLRFPASVRDQPDAPFWLQQTRIATAHAGEADPMDLDDYRQRAGFSVWAQLLADPAPAARAAARAHVRAQIAAAGLRGRGGAGFPTGRKWETVAAGPAPRHVVCNGDEGDPGAFMDRMLLESFPYRIIEGLALAAFAVDATDACFYIRHEYPVAVTRVRAAIQRCEQAGLLGSNILERGLDLRIRVVEGAGAFVCGEETALLASLEGRRGLPRVRPPYPAERGLDGRPTVVNNVETLALVPWILREGPDAFRAIGTVDSPGTKTFALAGRVVRGGLVEVPMGLTVRQIVEELGGGVPAGRRLKAVQIGGPSGGCLPAAAIDTPVDYASLLAAGTMMGSGGMIVLDDRDCMVDIARYFLAFTQRESCGLCTACRIGTRRMLEILEHLCAGTARPADLVALERLATSVARDSLCGLGRTAPNPVLSTLRGFRDEFEAHLAGRCPAGRCKALITYRIGAGCIGCTRCAQTCPARAIAFEPHRRHTIDAALCTRCDACRQVCPAQAVEVV